MAMGPLEVATLVAAGTEFEGLLAFRGTVRVEGRVVGDVVAAGCLWLAEGAELRGRVLADEVRVAGQIEGEIQARRRLELLPTARVRGFMTSPSLVVADGARFDGTCQAGPAGGAPDERSDEPELLRTGAESPADAPALA